MTRASTSAVLVALPALIACGDLIGIEERVPSEDTSSSDAASSGVTTSVATSTSASTTAAVTTSTTGGTGGDGGGGGGGGGGGAGATGGGGTGGCDADLERDASNCGACDHGCFGGECVGGECQPVLVTAGAVVAEYRALHADPGVDGFLYVARWRPNGAILRIAKTPGATPVELVVLEDGGWAHDLVLDHEWLYYTNYSDSDLLPSRGIHAIRRSGGEATQLARAQSDGSLSGTAFLAVDGPDVFFTTFFGSTAVGRVAFGGAPPRALWDLGDEPPYFENQSHVAVDDTWVYSGSNSQGVRRFRRDGTETQLLYPATTFANVFAVREGFVHWQDADRVIHQAPADGSGPVVDVATSGTHAPPCVGGDHVYFTDSGGHDVVRLPLSEPGREPEIVGHAEDFEVREIAVDEASVYWMDFGDAEIYRRAL